MPVSTFWLAIPATLIFVYLAAPVVGLILHLSPLDLFDAVLVDRNRQALATSIVTASVSTALVGALGVPLAFLLSRYRFPARRLVNLLTFLPLVLPPVTAGILLLELYGPNGAIGAILAPHGLQLVESGAGIVIAQMFVSASFVIVASRASFSALDREYEEAAATLGASTWQTFRYVSVPMCRLGIAAGMMLGWMRALGEFGATVVLAYHPYSVPVLNYVDLTSSGLAKTLPLAALTLLIAAAVILGLGWLSTGELVPQLYSRLRQPPP